MRWFCFSSSRVFSRHHNPIQCNDMIISSLKNTILLCISCNNQVKSNVPSPIVFGKRGKIRNTGMRSVTAEQRLKSIFGDLIWFELVIPNLQSTCDRLYKLETSISYSHYRLDMSDHSKGNWLTRELLSRSPRVFWLRCTYPGRIVLQTDPNAACCWYRTHQHLLQ